jgi:hypothetical protein
MYKQILRAADQYFGKGATLPANTTAQLAQALVTGAHAGALAVTAAASGAVSIPAATTLTVSLSDGDAEDALSAFPVSCAFSFADALTAADGDVLARFVLPDTKKFVKVTLGTNKAAVSGKVDVFLEYLAR